MSRPTREETLARLDLIRVMVDETSPAFDDGVCHPLLDQLRMLKSVVDDTITVVETYEPIDNEEIPCSPESN